MPYPHLNCEPLFYTESSAVKTYQTRPSGVPDYSRLAKGLPDFWLSPSMAKEQKKKKLILAVKYIRTDLVAYPDGAFIEYFING